MEFKDLYGLYLMESLESDDTLSSKQHWDAWEVVRKLVMQKQGVA